MQRSPVNEPLQTGIKAIRRDDPDRAASARLIIGDRQTGKDRLASHDHQPEEPGNRPILHHVAVDRSQSTVAAVVQTLQDAARWTNTIVVMAAPPRPAPCFYVAPYTAADRRSSLEGKAVLVIYDDLSKHRRGYRQLSLLLRARLAREALPRRRFLSA